MTNTAFATKIKEAIPRVSPRLSKPSQSSPDTCEPLKITVERVINRQEVRVIASAEPPIATQDSLNALGCREGNAPVWTCEDTPILRAALSELLNFEWVDDSGPLKEYTPEFQRFVEQTTRLQFALGLDLAGVALRAIDCLYTQTFND